MNIFQEFKNSRLQTDKELFAKQNLKPWNWLQQKSRRFIKKKSRKVLVSQKSYRNP